MNLALSNFILDWPILGIPISAAVYLLVYFSKIRNNRAIRLAVVSVPGFVFAAALMDPPFILVNDILVSIFACPTNILSPIILFLAFCDFFSKAKEINTVTRSELIFVGLLWLAYLYEQLLASNSSS
jgi:hypothetical protein